jgi:ribosomal protein S18 acetylase RimI-like enzyme
MADANSPQFRLLPLEERYLDGCLDIQNQIVAEGNSVPWEVPFTLDSLKDLYGPEDAVWLAVNDDDEVLGSVHIHPNREGRCSHVANCGYMVRLEARGRGVGKALVAKSIEVAREMGFVAIQFNAVVSTNQTAIALYKQFGFQIIATVPGGFRLGSADCGDLRYVDMHIMYLELYRPPW